MEYLILSEFLRFLWIGYQLWKQSQSQKREKAMVESLNNLNHRLCELENEIKKLTS
ncbi:MAG: hypothetical protein R2747_04935 [Pyrinomonadaceae bacterium]